MLRKTADDHHKKYPKAARLIKEDFYVDDVLTGECTVEEAVSLHTVLLGEARMTQSKVPNKSWILFQTN